MNNSEILPNGLVGKSFIDIQLLDLNKLLNLAGRHASHFVYASSVAVYGKQRYLFQRGRRHRRNKFNPADPPPSSWRLTAVLFRGSGDIFLKRPVEESAPFLLNIKNI